MKKRKKSAADASRFSRFSSFFWSTNPEALRTRFVGSRLCRNDLVEEVVV
jgi:hypothetical protein